MTDIIEQARKICLNLLELDPPINSDKIHEAITKVKGILPGIAGHEDALFERIQSVLGVTMDEPSILDYQQVEPWIANKRSQSGKSWNFWPRYSEYLLEEKKFPPVVVGRLDDLTDKILDRLGDPHQHTKFDRRGMVVGHVQSGKTSNYIGLICKAADAGYKVIVVLAGIHNSLRSQTQLRVDEGFLGYDTETSRVFNLTNSRIGVGRINREAAANSLTSSSINGDFKRTVAESVTISLTGNVPVVFVIKKNYWILNNLVNWLSGKFGEDFDGSGQRKIGNAPLLLVDDEADNASINISKSHVSAINGAIRSLLETFHQSAYIGYTATPYANIFIEPPHPDVPSKEVKVSVGGKEYMVKDDLFPRNFIINLPPPSNYIGPEKIFGIVSSAFWSTNEGEGPTPVPLFRIVKDHQPREYQDNDDLVDSLRNSNPRYIPDKHHNLDSKPDDLPESLKYAIRCFILSCAARRARGQDDSHNSMLIHVTRFVDWQNHITHKVREILTQFRRQIEFNQQDFLSELENQWHNEFVPVTEKVAKNPQIKDPDIKAIPWSEIKSNLFPAIAKIQIRAVHGFTRTQGLEAENLLPLDYYDHKKGLSVIAIGGNKLSRGLTLEGLTISYYLRSSKMYDTLMQMGRWFGYRPGYLDLCRLFTSEELVSSYRHITVATEEMRAEFDYMALQKKTPLDYGLKVRAHAGSLVITAANKFRYKKMMSFSYAGNLEEMYRFNRKRKDDLLHNFELTASFLTQLGKPTGLRNSSPYLKSQEYIWYRQDNWENVINYIYSFRSSQRSFITKLIGDYIKGLAENNVALTNWTIALIDNSIAKKQNPYFVVGNISVGLSFRTDATKDSENKDLYDPDGEWYEITKAHIIGNFHEYIDLTDDQLKTAIEDTAADNKARGKKVNPQGHPNTLRIRSNRGDSNALLLIYPLNPVLDKNRPAYSDKPIIGLAISFPQIDPEKDKKIVYAVNQIFEDALYDYPEFFDKEDTYGDTEEQLESAVELKSNVSVDKFIEFIEAPSNEIVYLDESEIESGVVYNKMINDDLSIENLVVPVNLLTADKVKQFKNFAFYEINEVQRFSVPKTAKWALLNPTEKIIEGEKVIGLKNSKYTLFAYSNFPCYVPDSCWIIRSPNNSGRYISALLNSSLFGAWVRISGQRKKDKYFITESVLSKFPIVQPDPVILSICETLVDYLSLTSEIAASEASTFTSYISDLLNSLLFTIYYPISAEQTGSVLRKYLIGFPKLNESTKKQDLQQVISYYKELYDKNHPVRKEVFFIDNIDKVKRIMSVFTE